MELSSRQAANPQQSPSAESGSYEGRARQLPGNEREFIRDVRRRLDDCKGEIEVLIGQRPHTDMDKALPREAMCAVCHGVLEKCVALVPCGHTFCSDCVNQWLKRTPSCPSCRTPVPTKHPSVRVRTADDLVDALLKEVKRCSALRLMSGRSDTQAEETCPEDDAPEHEDQGAETCQNCESTVASEFCGPCGASLDLCRKCAELEAWQCEECEHWFCSDWCACDPCIYCARPHVCVLCRKSPLRRCPRPEC
eukprot:TRINITY_DN91720_c0_g1_i1.p1 TRINITY_DN91720_c0_g1~~TRINITY_DN91720_c0_g1_i1.p1  ORF type:complete len:251 (+),score=16.65 TRINITY_DN91720_c0_g1_i1:58-810(+)